MAKAKQCTLNIIYYNPYLYLSVYLFIYVVSISIYIYIISIYIYTILYKRILKHVCDPGLHFATLPKHRTGELGPCWKASSWGVKLTRVGGFPRCPNIPMFGRLPRPGLATRNVQTLPKKQWRKCHLPTSIKNTRLITPYSMWWRNLQLTFLSTGSPGRLHHHGSLRA